MGKQLKTTGVKGTVERIYALSLSLSKAELGILINKLRTLHDTLGNKKGNTDTISL